MDAVWNIHNNSWTQSVSLIVVTTSEVLLQMFPVTQLLLHQSSVLHSSFYIYVLHVRISHIPSIYGRIYNLNLQYKDLYWNACMPPFYAYLAVKCRYLYSDHSCCSCCESCPSVSWSIPVVILFPNFFAEICLGESWILCHKHKHSPRYRKKLLYLWYDCTESIQLPFGDFLANKY